MTDSSSSQEPIYACDLTAIPPREREKHIATSLEVFRSVQTVHELPNGYEFLLPNDTGMLLKAAAFIANERLCCPFFGFALEIEPNGGPAWLRLSGAEGIKPFIRAEIDPALDRLF
jgi:hypothetical protein